MRVSIGIKVCKVNYKAVNSLKCQSNFSTLLKSKWALTYDTTKASAQNAHFLLMNLRPT